MNNLTCAYLKKKSSELEQLAVLVSVLYGRIRLVLCVASMQSALGHCRSYASASHLHCKNNLLCAVYMMSVSACLCAIACACVNTTFF